MRFTALRLITASLTTGLILILLYTQKYHSGRHISLPSFFTGKPTSPLLVSPTHNSTAVPKILVFWQEWASRIAAAKPRARPVHIDYPASNVPAPEGPLARRQKPKSYTRLTEGDVGLLKEAHAKLRSNLIGLEDEDISGKVFTGQGVVTVAGGEYFGPAIVGIRMLRQTGSQLPVEVFLGNWKEYEALVCEKVLPALNAKCVVLEDYIKAKPVAPLEPRADTVDFEIGHYQLKTLAVLLSSFQHVLYLDSDSIVIVDPEKELFPTEPYSSYGMVGWPDFWKSTEEPRFYEIAGSPVDDFPANLPAASSEAGQLLVDKARHLGTLLLAAYYNVWGPDFYYPLLSQGAMGQGDKETFLAAAWALDRPMYRVKTAVKSVGRYNSGKFKGSAMVQWHPVDDLQQFAEAFDQVERRQVDEPLGKAANGVRPAFVHSNTPKMNAGHLVAEGDLQDEKTRERLRLWGPLEEQEAMFGEDLERKAWEIMIEVGCALEGVLEDWKKTKDICVRLKEHWRDVFESDTR